MNMNKKRFAWLMSCTLAVALLSACGNSNTGNGNAGANAPAGENHVADAEKTLIKYWTNDRHDADFISSIVDKYNAENQDGVEVEMTVMSENYEQTVDIAYASNETPDVLRVKDNNIRDFYKKGFLAPIDEYLDDEMKSKFEFGIVDNVNRYDGKVYSLPAFGQTMRLIYNKDLFEKAGIAGPPKTAEELVAAAKTITEMGKQDGIYGFALPFKAPVGAFHRSIPSMLAMSGYQGSGFDIQKGQFDFTHYGKAVDYYKQMWDAGSMLPGSESLEIDPLRAQFAQGKIGMYFSFSVEPGVYENQFPTQINWGAAHPPALEAGNTTGAAEIRAAGTWLGISENSKNKDKAWSFMKYMYANEIMVAYQEKKLGLAVLPEVAEQVVIPEGDIMNEFKLTQQDAIWPPTPAVTQEGKDYREEFFVYMLSGGNLQEIVADLNARYNTALDKAKAEGKVQVEPDPDFNPSQLKK